MRLEVLNTKSRSEWILLITEWIHDERDRKMLERQLLDGITIEQIAEEFNLSPVQVQKRLRKAREQLFKKI